MPSGLYPDTDKKGNPHPAKGKNKQWFDAKGNLRKGFVETTPGHYKSGRSSRAKGEGAQIGQNKLDLSQVHKKKMVLPEGASAPVKVTGTRGSLYEPYASESDYGRGSDQLGYGDAQEAHDTVEGNDWYLSQPDKNLEGHMPVQFKGQIDPHEFWGIPLRHYQVALHHGTTPNKFKKPFTQEQRDWLRRHLPMAHGNDRPANQTDRGLGDARIRVGGVQKSKAEYTQDLVEQRDKLALRQGITKPTEWTTSAPQYKYGYNQPVANRGPMMNANKNIPGYGAGSLFQTNDEYKASMKGAPVSSLRQTDPFTFKQFSKASHSSTLSNIMEEGGGGQAPKPRGQRPPQFKIKNPLPGVPYAEPAHIPKQRVFGTEKERYDKERKKARKEYMDEIVAKNPNLSFVGIKNPFNFGRDAHSYSRGGPHSDKGRWLREPYEGDINYWDEADHTATMDNWHPKEVIKEKKEPIEPHYIIRSDAEMKAWQQWHYEQNSNPHADPNAEFIYNPTPKKTEVVKKKKFKIKKKASDAVKAKKAVASAPTSAWQAGYLKGYSFSAKESTFSSFDEAHTKAKLFPDLVAGITKHLKKGKTVYSLRKGGGKQIFSSPGGEQSYITNKKKIN